VCEVPKVAVRESFASRQSQLLGMHNHFMMKNIPIDFNLGVIV